MSEIKKLKQELTKLFMNQQSYNLNYIQDTDSKYQSSKSLRKTCGYNDNRERKEFQTIQMEIANKDHSDFDHNHYTSVAKKNISKINLLSNFEYRQSIQKRKVDNLKHLSLKRFEKRKLISRKELGIENSLTKNSNKNKETSNPLYMTNCTNQQLKKSFSNVQINMKRALNEDEIFIEIQDLITHRKTLAKKRSQSLLRKNQLFFNNFLNQRKRQIKMRNEIQPHINHMSNITKQINLNCLDRPKKEIKCQVNKIGSKQIQIRGNIKDITKIQPW